MIIIKRIRYKIFLTIAISAFLLAMVPSITAQRGFGGFDRDEEELRLVERFDTDGDGILNTTERAAARESLTSTTQRGMGGFSRGGSTASGTPGPELSPADVEWYDDEPLYDLLTLRTLFLEFENDDWERELADFYHTGVEVPAQLTVDGETYTDVGVRFRGNTSYSMVSAGLKRPLNLTIDYVRDDQRLLGYRTLNLHNGHTDPSFLRTVLYQYIAREYIPALKANYVRLVINGESWGIYVNVEQYNTDFIDEWFGTREGGRWKVPANMRGGGGLNYLGEDPAAYKSVYEIKSKDESTSWADLINLCRVLNETPLDELEEVLEPILDIDGALRFLAIEKTLVNNDGYWIRASDYLLYQDEAGRFHLIPYDVNESMTAGGGMGGRGGRFGGGPGGGGGVTLDPLTGANDSNKPLLYRLLAIPSLKARYLSYIRDIAEKWLDWDRIGPLAQQYQELIAADIEIDTRKIFTTEAFYSGLDQDTATQSSSTYSGGSGTSLRSFVDQRREYLLSHPEVSNAARL